MRLFHGGIIHLRAPEGPRVSPWAADLGIIAAEGNRPSAAVYLTEDECRELSKRLAEFVVADTQREDG